MSQAATAIVSAPVEAEVVETSSVELHQPERHGLTIANLEDAERLALRFAKSRLIPDAYRDKPADVFLALNFGLELGLSPVSSLRAIHVVKGRPALAADAMVGVILSSGAARYFQCVESSEESATYETHRVGAPKPVRKTFTRADAERAGLIQDGSGHAKYPRHMMEARAKANLARDVYPDVLHGVYCPEELAELDPPKMSEEPPPSAETSTLLMELRELLRACESGSDLKRLAAKATQLSKSEQEEFEVEWAAHRAHLYAEWAAANPEAAAEYEAGKSAEAAQ